MKALKVAVVAMGVLIVAGFAFVVVTIVGRVTGDSPLEQLGSLALEIPADCSLADAWSADGLLYVRLGGPASKGCAVILLVDPQTGSEAGRVTLTPGTSAPASVTVE